MILQKEDSREERFSEYTEQELIDRQVCPKCYEGLSAQTGCWVCFNCGFSVCS